MSALKNGDVIALYLDDDDDKLGAKLGYLGVEARRRLGLPKRPRSPSIDLERGFMR